MKFLYINMDMSIWYKSPLVYFHVLTHLSLVPMLLYGTITSWLVALVAFYLFGCWGVAITFHRFISHRSFVAPMWFRNVGIILGSLGGVGSTIEWTAVHRDHHKNVDTDKDPHSPKGSWQRFLKIQFFTMLVPSSPRFVVDLLRDKFQTTVHQYYWLIHAAYAALLFLIDPFAIVYAYLIPSLFLWHTMTSLGTFAHTSNFGYQNYDNKDSSRNLWFLGLFAFGEGWHNNHHHRPSSYSFGHKKWEFDLSAKIIDFIRTDKITKAQ